MKLTDILELDVVLKWCIRRFPDVASSCRDEMQLLSRVKQILLKSLEGLPKRRLLTEDDKLRMKMLSNISLWIA